MDMKELLEVFRGVYSRLYDDTSETGLIIESICSDEFDEYMQGSDAFKELVSAFGKYRQDFITSDRECAAFMIAYKTVARREAFKKAGLIA